MIFRAIKSRTWSIVNGMTMITPRIQPENRSWGERPPRVWPDTPFVVSVLQVRDRSADFQTASQTRIHWMGLCFALAFMASSGIAAPSSATNDANDAKADFFVSPRGNDNWSGKLAEPGANDGPFATLSRARDAVRSLLKAQKRTIRVVVRGGTYYLDSPLEFGTEDSGREHAPVVYAAAAGERVVLSGGRRIEGGRWGEVNGRKVWLVDVQQVKEGQWRFRQLFVNGARRPRTRLPKQGEYRIESLPGYTGDFLRSPTKQFV